MNLDDAWVIWSRKHNAWWRANQSGYCRELLNAGVYSEEEARSCEGHDNEATLLRDAVKREGGYPGPTVIELMMTPRGTDSQWRALAMRLQERCMRARECLKQANIYAAIRFGDKAHACRTDALCAVTLGGFEPKVKTGVPDLDAMLDRLRAVLGGGRDHVDAEGLLTEVRQRSDMALAGLFPEHPELDAWHADLRRLKGIEDENARLRTSVDDLENRLLEAGERGE